MGEIILDILGVLAIVVVASAIAIRKVYQTFRPYTDEELVGVAKTWGVPVAPQKTLRKRLSDRVKGSDTGLPRKSL